MYTFLISVAALVVGYILYGAFVDRVFGPDSTRKTPAVEKADGVDFVPMPTWKVFMIQFLNIAGTGPIFGAIMGAMFGPSAFLWIVFGCIFAGAVHDYFTGMLSIRHGGAALPEIVGHYLGKGTKTVMLCFSVLLMLLVGVVFVYSPAVILGPMVDLSFGAGGSTSMMIWVFIILAYYVVATLLPVDKIIGKIYPVFAVALLFMAVALCFCLLRSDTAAVPELWDGLANRKGPGAPIFPCLFITIACGAISGFHATQSPLMARCLKDEKLGRPVFYGAMITEGLVALIWAAVASWVFWGGGKELILGAGFSVDGGAPAVVTAVSKYWLGIFGGILAILGVVAAPITSGDTAFRSARLIIADFLKLDQKQVRNRLVISVPLFALGGLLLWYNIADPKGFDRIWGYFGWANQTLAVFSLWTVTSYLVKKKRGFYYLITLIPAIFMTSVTFTYFCIEKIGFNLILGPLGHPIPASWNLAIGGVTAIVSLVLFILLSRKAFKNRNLSYNPA
ncbi:MAG: carbon starvation protein A [Bacteroidales bacterium]|nr:carbon starvation protein A [Bacteroidales bacterium]